MTEDVRYLAVNAAVSLGTGFFNLLFMAENENFKIPALLATLSCIYVGFRDLKAASCLDQETKKEC